MTKKWANGIYSYNNNFTKNLPIADNIVHKLIKNYFAAKVLNYDYNGKLKKTRLVIRRLFRLSLNTILVSKPEIKHFSDKVNITIYLYNKKKSSLLNRLSKITNLLKYSITNKKNTSIGYNLKYKPKMLSRKLKTTSKQKFRYTKKKWTYAERTRSRVRIKNNISIWEYKQQLLAIRLKRKLNFIQYKNKNFNLESLKDKLYKTNLFKPSNSKNGLKTFGLTYKPKANTKSDLKHIKKTRINSLVKKSVLVTRNNSKKSVLITRNNSKKDKIIYLLKNLNYSYILNKYTFILLKISKLNKKAKLEKMKFKLNNKNKLKKNRYNFNNKFNKKSKLNPIIKNKFNFDKKTGFNLNYLNLLTLLIKNLYNINNINKFNPNKKNKFKLNNINKYNSNKKNKLNFNKKMKFKPNKKLLSKISNIRLLIAKLIYLNLIKHSKSKNTNFKLSNFINGGNTLSTLKKLYLKLNLIFDIYLSVLNEKNINRTAALKKNKKQDTRIINLSKAKPLFRHNKYNSAKLHNNLNKTRNSLLTSNLLIKGRISKLGFKSFGLKKGTFNVKNLISKKNLLSKYKTLDMYYYKLNTNISNLLPIKLNAYAFRPLISRVTNIMLSEKNKADLKHNITLDNEKNTTSLKSEKSYKASNAKVRTFNLKRKLIKKNMSRSRAFKQFILQMSFNNNNYVCINLAGIKLTKHQKIILNKIYLKTKVYDMYKVRNKLNLYNNYFFNKLSINKFFNINQFSINNGFKPYQINVTNKRKNSLKHYNSKRVKNNITAKNFNKTSKFKNLSYKNIKRLKSIKNKNIILRKLHKINEFINKYYYKNTIQSLLLKSKINLNGLNNIKPTEAVNFTPFVNAKPYEIFLNKIKYAYKFEYLKNILIKETRYINYIKMLSNNSMLYKSWLLTPLKFLISKIYNKQVIFNFVNLKYLYLSSDLLTQAIVLKLKSIRKNRLNNVLRKVLNLVLVSRYNEYAENRLDPIYKYIERHYNNYKQLNSHIFENRKKTHPKFNYKTSCLKGLNAIQTNTIKFIKYKSVFGVKFEAAGRLTKRSTASRAVFKFRFKGNLKNHSRMTREINTRIKSTNLISNIQFTKLTSKTRNGSFGIKTWINNN